MLSIPSGISFPDLLVTVPEAIRTVVSGVLLPVGSFRLFHTLPPHFRTFDQSSKKHTPNGQPKLTLRQWATWLPSRNGSRWRRPRRFRDQNISGNLFSFGPDVAPFRCVHPVRKKIAIAAKFPSRFRDTLFVFYSNVGLVLGIYICIVMFPLATHTLKGPAGGNRFLSVTHARTHTHTHKHTAQERREKMKKEREVFLTARISNPV